MNGLAVSNTSTGLLARQRMDYPQPLPTPLNPRSDQPSKGSSPVFEVRHTMGLQQRTNQTRRRMESSLHHQ